MTDQEDPEERRTEGVRIIGAQEAAEAAGRPDVVRRRRGGEKRYGDRPDRPAPASDLPKITISTTEGELGDQPDRFGSVPVVRPGGDDADDGASLQWADDESNDADERVYGHARLIANEPEPEPELDTEAELEPEPEPEPGPEPERVVGPGGDVGVAPAPEMDRWTSSAAFEPIDPEEVGAPAGFDDPPAFDDPDATQSVSYDDLAGEAEPPSGTDPGPPAVERPGSFDDAFTEADADDSFVLPHWTEPPTGQVPKVVIGDDAPDPEPLATYGSQPRWRDEGERTGAHDFDDLIGDGPSLGVLGPDDSVEDDFFSDDGYADERFTDDAVGEYDDDEFYDDIDDEAGGQAPRRTAAEPRDGGSGGGDRNLVTAVAVGVGLVGVGLLCFYLGAFTTMILAAVVVTFAALEYFTAVRTAGHNPATLLGIVGVAGMMVAAYTSGLAAYPVVLGLTVLGGLLWFLWVAPGEGAVPNLGLTLLGVLWVGVLGSFATLFLGLGRAVQDGSPDITSNPGIGVFIAAVIASVSHDVGAYFIGRYFGRTPLSSVSPNKTQEGLAGGVLVSLVVTFVVVGLIGIEPIGAELSQAFIFALLCALVAPLGDLSESFIKRDLKIKDMGSVLPGHGGVLDRFDALLFVLPVAYFVTVLFDIWSNVS